MAVSHPDFRSIVKGIYTADDIDDLVGVALIYQNMFDRRTSPWEIAEWQENELENFCIESCNVDRLYHIYHFDDDVSGREYELLARLDYHGRSIYVKLCAGCDYTGFDCQGGGEIYLSFDAQVFLKSIVNNDQNPRGIWESMVEDGLMVEEPSDFDFQQVRTWNNVPMLKFLCHMTVYNQHDRLRHYDEVLPNPVAASIEEFVRVRQTRDHYDNGF